MERIEGSGALQRFERYLSSWRSVTRDINPSAEGLFFPVPLRRIAKRLGIPVIADEALRHTDLLAAEVAPKGFLLPNDSVMLPDEATPTSLQMGLAEELAHWLRGQPARKMVEPEGFASVPEFMVAYNEIEWMTRVIAYELIAPSLLFIPAARRLQLYELVSAFKVNAYHLLLHTLLLTDEDYECAFYSRLSHAGPDILYIKDASGSVSLPSESPEYHLTECDVARLDREDNLSVSKLPSGGGASPYAAKSLRLKEALPRISNFNSLGDGWIFSEVQRVFSDERPQPRIVDIEEGNVRVRFHIFISSGIDYLRDPVVATTGVCVTVHALPRHPDKNQLAHYPGWQVKQAPETLSEWLDHMKTRINHTLKRASNS